MKWLPNKPPYGQFKAGNFRKIAKVASFVYQLGESPILRERSKEVPVGSITTKEYQIKIKYLKDCLTKYRKLTGYGRGLAAVQVGIPERFSVVYTPEKLLLIINPVVTKRSEKKLKYPEICMSFQPVIVPVIRPSWIEFDYYNEDGKAKKWNIKDDTDAGRALNRLFQHEFDHMDGIFHIDRVSSAKEIFMESDPEFYSKAAFEEVK